MSDKFIPEKNYPNGTAEYPYRKIFGYARVSTEDQDMKMQIDALEKYGVDKIFQEKKSAVAVRRKQFETLVNSLREGDVIVVWKIDRIGRRLLDIADFVKMMEDKGVQLVSLTQMIDTTNPMGKFFFYLLALFAELERDMTIERTTTGMEAARKRGVKFGQPSTVFGVKRLRILMDIWGLNNVVDHIPYNYGYKSRGIINTYFKGERTLAREAMKMGADAFFEARELRFRSALREEIIEGNLDKDGDYDFILTEMREIKAPPKKRIKS